METNWLVVSLVQTTLYKLETKLLIQSVRGFQKNLEFAAIILS